MLQWQFADYELVKEGESAIKEKEPERPVQIEKLNTEEVLKRLLEDHKAALKQHADKMRDLEEALEKQTAMCGKVTTLLQRSSHRLWSSFTKRTNE